MLRSCFLSNFFESRSAVSEVKSKMSQPIMGHGGHLFFTHRPEKHKLGKGGWDLASCQVSLNSVKRFLRRSRKCLSQSEMLKSVGHAGKTDKICSCPTKVTQIPVQTSDVFLKWRFCQMRQSIESWPLECFILYTLYYKASNWLGISE